MKIIKSLAALAAFGMSAFGVANANLITIEGGLGTITCTPDCTAFTLGAPALGDEPNAAGTLSSTNAWFYDGQPASENAEAVRLNTLLGAPGTFSGADGVKTNGTGGDMTFDLNAAFAMIKIGNVSVFIATAGVLTNVVVDSFAGAGSGVSHFTAFGEFDGNEVPLPAAGWLMLAGAAGLGFAGRRRKAA
jgi:hypothetical protein